MAVSLQLYSMREHADQIALLAELPAMGISMVEGYGGVYGDPAAYRAAMDANGITMPTGHMGLADIEADFAATMEIVKTMGMQRVYAPYLEEKDRPTTAIARALEVVESKGGLNDILGFDEEEFMLEHFL